MDDAAPDFTELLSAALITLRTGYPELWFRSLLPRLRPDLTDEFRFSKETVSPSGLIRWPDGQELIEAARATLTAGVKAHRRRERYFSNRFGSFAKRYLDTVLMGQTAVGSYVVTAYVPSMARVPLGLGPSGFDLEGIDIAIAGEVTQSVVGALEAMTEPIAHYRQASSMTAFEAGVERGVSHEMATALGHLTSNSDAAEIVVEWSPRDIEQSRMSRSHFVFEPNDNSILSRAAAQLSTPEQSPQSHRARGRVHLLTKKEAGDPGVVGIDDGKRKYRVRLTSEAEYHEAVMAHDENLIVEVVGELSREGNIQWLYQARLSRVPPLAHDATLQVNEDLPPNVGGGGDT